MSRFLTNNRDRQSKKYLALHHKLILEVYPPKAPYLPKHIRKAAKSAEHRAGQA